MRDNDDLPYIIIERQSAGIAPFLWGALLGAGAALLLAPRSGAETQEDIRASVSRVRFAAEEKVGAARDTVARTRERIEDQIGTVRDQFGAVRGQIDERTDRARQAFDSGRRAARQAREELERRVADVKESYQSVADRVAQGRSGRGTGSDVVITDVTEERIEGGTDLG
jgi:gas vesicle protein